MCDVIEGVTPYLAEYPVRAERAYTARDTGVQLAILGGAESCRREQSALEGDRGVSWYTSEAV